MKAMIDPRFYDCLDDGMTVRELCDALGLIAPDGAMAEERVHKPAALSGSVAGDVCFLGSKRHLDQLERARATACFVNERLAPDVAARRIIPLISRFPKYHLARATALLVSDTETPSEVHPDAELHPTVVIGPGVTIGAGTRVGAYTVIERAVIGRDCQIGSGTIIGGAGFGAVASPDSAPYPVPHVGRVVIGDRVRIGSNSCVDRGQLGDTIIGDDTQIDNLVQIAHNCHLGRRCLIAGRVGISGSCVIGDGVQMGGSVGLADHVKIGDGARLAAFAGVMNDVPAGETWSGIPAMPIREHMKTVAFVKKSVRRGSSS